jgi:hypothetical protein
MSTYQEVSRSFQAPASTGGVLKMLATEALVLAQALLNPRKIIAEVEQFRALCQQADRLEASDPSGAAALRRQAARIGMD